jgi:ABC-type bacteriocin/lantibiotic exporter with double-glycine peptidase domain
MIVLPALKRPAAVVLTVLLLAGCAGSIQDSQVLPSASGVQAAHLVVPFFPDDTDQCGPATLASLFSYWGVPADPVALRQEVYLPKLRGSLSLDMLLAAKKRGLAASIQHGDLELLKTEVKSGHPMVAFLNLAIPLFPQGHYVVVTGYDDLRQGLYLHSGTDQDSFVSYDRFLPAWEKTGRWLLLVSAGSRN